MSTEPQTLVEAVRYFADPEVTHNTMVELRWPSGVCCPTCGRVDVRFIATRRMWECKEQHPKKQFSSKVGTIFEDSPLSLDKWFVAIWMIANCKNGVSSYELARALGITQKSAWFMLHRIRLAMQTGSFIKSGGEFEADETFVGGKAKNMSPSRRAKSIPGSGVAGKQVVMGVLKRGTVTEPSIAIAAHIPNRKKAQVHAAVRSAAEIGSALYTDALQSYTALGGDYIHQVVDHAVEYVRDNVHTNGMENFWSLFKRALKGTYVSVEPVHLDAYVKEQTFRFNERKDNDSGRFRKTLAKTFRTLRDKWRQERGFTSSITKMVMCYSYQRIIGMGPSAIPLILRELEEEGDEPDMWFWALNILTGANPVPEDLSGDVVAMSHTWLNWARYRYVW